MIGSRADAHDPSKWDEIAQSLRSTAVEIVLRDLVGHVSQHGDLDTSRVVKQRPEWLVQHIGSRADAGTIAELDLDRFGAVVRDVERWRSEHGLTDADTPLGAVPNDALLRAERKQLQRRLAIRPRPDSGRSIA